ncbi:response regulator [Sphingobium sp. Ant17]|uniref:response regulator n=1 Tax=Sphingobium sp. Ant17 TaxID=1461752 RepID=UPI0004535910|nr:response regulator [Sphingobium sp. Ant17]EXS68724.1 chemotaxis protein CheY [Sphingobium sp. Ant17]OHC98586.1 MAG: hypothetical protein A2095_16100 [Sphingomonadales bacterium GWF1_63_6]
MSRLLAGCRILIVEDEMLVLRGVEIALEELGCDSIHVAANVADALTLLAQNAIDAALLDVNLGGENSYSVADALVHAGIPFAFSTGYGDHGDRQDFDDRPVLRKPYVRATFTAVFEQLAQTMRLTTEVKYDPVERG